jgi:hypothetical protein
VLWVGDYQVFGLEDRLWTGYWSGGTTLSIMVILAALGDLPSWVAIVLWIAVTPLGILITKLYQS